MKMDGFFAGQPKKSSHNNRKVTYYRGDRKAGFHCRKTHKSQHFPLSDHFSNSHNSQNIDVNHC